MSNTTFPGIQKEMEDRWEVFQDMFVPGHLFRISATLDLPDVEIYRAIQPHMYFYKDELVMLVEAYDRGDNQNYDMTFLRGSDGKVYKILNEAWWVYEARFKRIRTG